MATAFNIVKRVTSKGNSLIGCGSYAAVLQHGRSTDRVIKVGNNIYDPWLDYYRLVIKPNAANAYVPRTYSLHVDVSANYYICVMERLQPLHDYGVAELCEHFVQGHITEQEFINAAAKHFCIIDANAALQILYKIRDLTDYADKFAIDDSENGRVLDMHAANFMLRGEQLVITDPWCDSDMTNSVDFSEWADHNL